MRLTSAGPVRIQILAHSEFVDAVIAFVTRKVFATVVIKSALALCHIIAVDVKRPRATAAGVYGYALRCSDRT